MVETTSCYMAARVVENKSYTGSKDQKVAMAEEFIKETGYKISHYNVMENPLYGI